MVYLRDLFSIDYILKILQIHIKRLMGRLALDLHTFFIQMSMFLPCFLYCQEKSSI